MWQIIQRREITVCPVPALFSVWNVELSAARHLCLITIMVTTQRRASFLNAAMRTLQLQFSKLLLCLSLAIPPTRHDSVSVCFRFMDNSSLSITPPVFGYESNYKISRYINQRKQSLLLRKAVLPFWFIYHYIWTFLYLHYLHFAFTQDRKRIPKRKDNLKKKKVILFNLVLEHDTKY